MHVMVDFMKQVEYLLWSCKKM